eukprot:NODE_33_length_36935_cov_1.609241.p33 type:complete len:104 gc:universal NODE_33_length_36935_cov_1.609241:5258-4947(-)
MNAVYIPRLNLGFQNQTFASLTEVETKRMLSHDLEEMDIKLNLYCGFEEFQPLPPFQLPLPPLVKPIQKKKRNALISGDPVCPVCKKQFCDQSTALRHLKNVD